jgi:ABC-2 type transport system permease protein
VPQALGIIERSPATARLVVVGSAEFLNDVVFDLSRNLSGDRYLNSLQFAQNMVDWSVEDLELLGIRSRGTASRVLLPLTPQAQSVAELGNYGLALVALLGLAWTWQRRRRKQPPMELLPPAAARKRQESAAEVAA